MAQLVPLLPCYLAPYPWSMPSLHLKPHGSNLATPSQQPKISHTDAGLGLVFPVFLNSLDSLDSLIFGQSTHLHRHS